MSDIFEKLVPGRQRPANVRIPKIIIGRVLGVTPAGLRFTIPSWDGGRHAWGPCPWPSWSQVAPTPGDRCFIIFIREREGETPVCVGWEPATPVTPPPTNAPDLVEVLYQPVSDAAVVGAGSGGVFVSTSRPWVPFYPDCLGLNLVGVAATLDVAGTTETTVTPHVNGVPVADAATIAAGDTTGASLVTSEPFLEVGVDRLTFVVDPAGTGAEGLVCYAHLRKVLA